MVEKSVVEVLKNCLIITGDLYIWIYWKYALIILINPSKWCLTITNNPLEENSHQKDKENLEGIHRASKVWIFFCIQNMIQIFPTCNFRNFHSLFLELL